MRRQILTVLNLGIGVIKGYGSYLSILLGGVGHCH